MLLAAVGQDEVGDLEDAALSDIISDRASGPPFCFK